MKLGKLFFEIHIGSTFACILLDAFVIEILICKAKRGKSMENRNRSLFLASMLKAWKINNFEEKLKQFRTKMFRNFQLCCYFCRMNSSKVDLKGKSGKNSGNIENLFIFSDYRNTGNGFFSYKTAGVKCKIVIGTILVSYWYPKHL